MKQFFFTVFGGLFAIGIGVGIAYGSGKAWNFLSPRIANIRTNSIEFISKAVGETNDGSTISGLKRTIRWSANEEEDPVIAAEAAFAKNKQITAVAYYVSKLTGEGKDIEQNSEKLMPIASLTKLVTAEVTRRLIDKEKKITITREIMSAYGNTAEFNVGETFTAEDLMYPLLMVSSNDAAEAFARAYGRQKFIQEMNNFTQSIGAYRTYLVDPSGLSSLNVSTAKDMVIILDWLRKNDPELIAITQLKSKIVRNHTWENPNHFLSWSNYLGGKNGYTPEANRTAASFFSVGKDKDIYAIVLLGSDARDTDQMKLLGKIE